VGLEAVCPKSKEHNRFSTTAHVTQTWEVDRNGNFSRELTTDDTTHGPDAGNHWTCLVCGATADVTRTP